MKRLIVVGLLLGLALLVGARPAQAFKNPSAGAQALCLPGVYAIQTDDCSPAGPSAYLTSMAETGFVFPERPLPAGKPDFSLTNVNVRYGQVRTQNAPVYPSVEAALENKKKDAIQRIDSPFSYISYAEEALVGNKRFYMIAPGSWMTANDVSRLGSLPLFQGLTFKQTPNTAFGWVLGFMNDGPIETKRTPGYGTPDYTGHILTHHEIVWVYAEQEIDGVAWYMIGPNEWVHEKVLARVVPNPAPPEGVTGDRWIEVNLFEQTIAVYENRQLVFATLIASGSEPFWTRPGVFQIYQKLETTPMRGSFEADGADAYDLEDVPWTMYFDEARALHGAYWRANLGYPQSHGCVNLSVGDAHWLFDWAKDGDYVYVWDPSGKSPVDPSVYGSGGA